MYSGSRQLNFALLILAAWLCVALQLMLKGWPEAALTLGGTDDAMRLVQVREFLAGRGWFDLHMTRLQPPVGYDPHWSRLIDAGLAGVFILFHQVVDAALAERLMRAVWPILWLLPAIVGVAAIAWRIAGRPAAVVVLLLVVVGMPAFQQFRPGRIDHHNVQIALAVLTLGAAAWCDRSRWIAAVAGALTGLAMAVGLEALPFLVVAGAVPALRYVLEPTGAGALRSYGLALAASTAAAFLVSAGPDHWSRSICDSMAINLMAPTVAAGLLLAAAAHWLARGGLATRGAAVAGIVALAAAISVAIEPRCIGGPYATMVPELRTIWMGHVSEMQPLLTLARNKPEMAAAILAFPAVTTIAVVSLARNGNMRRNPGAVLATAAFLLAVMMTVVAAKMHSYAHWVAMPLMAAWLLHLFARFRLETFASRMFAAILLAPAVLSAGAAAAVQAAGHGNDRTGRDQPGKQACFDSANYAQLARLPKGLVASNIDYGPFILALTPHSALAAPYHRLSTGIRDAREIFSRPPEEAYRTVVGLRVNYLATCGSDAPMGLTDEERATSLWGRLQSGNFPDWLAVEPAMAGQRFRVYRVR